eukprot:scpid82188/ scgid27623/ 
MKKKCEKFKKDITDKMVAKTDSHSNFCHFNLLHHRVRNTEVITYAKVDNVKATCNNSLGKINRQIKKCKKPKQMEQKGKYIEGLIDASEVEMNDVFSKWGNADDSLYDNTLKTTKRKECLGKVSKNIKTDYMESWKYAQELS